uniref:BPTI/Kunitz inhibitor domain-containing protein n=1 Tax=Varanus komodoensis TaxID=61221 RepID=A0A8D2KZ48_VARKO
GGCGGNKNNFVNPELCLRFSPWVPPAPSQLSCCPASGSSLGVWKKSPHRPDLSNRSRDVAWAGVCTLPADGGLCFMLEERWYFDHEEKKCQPFSWGGCGGNENNFGSRPECESACSPYGNPPFPSSERGSVDPHPRGQVGGRVARAQHAVAKRLPARRPGTEASRPALATSHRGGLGPSGLPVSGSSPESTQGLIAASFTAG